MAGDAGTVAARRCDGPGVAGRSDPAGHALSLFLLDTNAMSDLMKNPAGAVARAIKDRLDSQIMQEGARVAEGGRRSTPFQVPLVCTTRRRACRPVR